MKYIVRTRKPNATHPSEIVGYEVSSTKSSNGTYYTKDKFFDQVYSDSEDYESYNSETQETASLVKKTSSTGEHFLQSNPNTASKDNLLELPDC